MSPQVNLEKRRVIDQNNEPLVTKREGEKLLFCTGGCSSFAFLLPAARRPVHERHAGGEYLVRLGFRPPIFPPTSFRQGRSLVSPAGVSRRSAAQRDCDAEYVYIYI